MLVGSEGRAHVESLGICAVYGRSRQYSAGQRYDPGMSTRLSGPPRLRTELRTARGALMWYVGPGAGWRGRRYCWEMSPRSEAGLGLLGRPDTLRAEHQSRRQRKVSLFGRVHGVLGHVEVFPPVLPLGRNASNRVPATYGGSMAASCAEGNTSTIRSASSPTRDKKAATSSWFR
jgi:hypothetical protein